MSGCFFETRCTLWDNKKATRYIFNNSVKNKPIMMIFDILVPEKI